MGGKDIARGEDIARGDVGVNRRTGVGSLKWINVKSVVVVECAHPIGTIK